MFTSTLGKALVLYVSTVEKIREAAANVIPTVSSDQPCNMRKLGCMLDLLCCYFKKALSIVS